MLIKCRIKYLLRGGDVRSMNDWQVHFVSARTLCNLYNLNPADCILWDGPQDDHKLMGLGPSLYEMVELGPRYDGNYTLPRR